MEREKERGREKKRERGREREKERVRECQRMPERFEKKNKVLENVTTMLVRTSC